MNHYPTDRHALAREEALQVLAQVFSTPRAQTELLLLSVLTALTLRQRAGHPPLHVPAGSASYHLGERPLCPLLQGLREISGHYHALYPTSPFDAHRAVQAALIARLDGSPELGVPRA